MLGLLGSRALRAWGQLARLPCNLGSVPCLTQLDDAVGTHLNCCSVKTITQPLVLLQAYVDRFTTDLAVELEPFGVTVENQAPFYVATKMSKIRRPRLDAPTPKAWVATGIRQIGCATIKCIMRSAPTNQARNSMSSF